MNSLHTFYIEQLVNRGKEKVTAWVHQNRAVIRENTKEVIAKLIQGAGAEKEYAIYTNVSKEIDELEAKLKELKEIRHSAAIKVANLIHLDTDRCPSVGSSGDQLKSSVIKPKVAKEIAATNIRIEGAIEAAEIADEFGFDLEAMNIPDQPRYYLQATKLQLRFQSAGSGGKACRELAKEIAEKYGFEGIEYL